MPGCFGSVFLIKLDSGVCMNCALRAKCKIEAEATLEKMKIDQSSLYQRRIHQQKVVIGEAVVEQPITSPIREHLTESQLTLVNDAQYPLRARQLVASLFRKGISTEYIRRYIKQGINPFRNATPAILESACDLLINQKLSRNSLIGTIKQRSGVCHKTAHAQACNAITIFSMMKLIDEDEGSFSFSEDYE